MTAEYEPTAEQRHAMLASDQGLAEVNGALEQAAKLQLSVRHPMRRTLSARRTN